MLPYQLCCAISGIVLLETMSQFSAKNYYINKNLYFFALSFILYLPVLVLLVYSYNFASFAIANALWDSGTIIAMALIGYFYFGEKPNYGEMAGMGLVVIGALTLGFTSSGGKSEGEV